MARLREEHDAAEEAALRLAVLAGDTSAWRSFYDRHYDALFAYVLSKTGRHRQRTEEVVQDAWLIAVRRIRRFNPERAPFGAWLHGIADGVLRNHARKWSRRDRTERPLEEHESRFPGPARNKAEESEHIDLALGALPDDYRDALEAKYVEGQTVAEMAASQRKTPKAVESLLSRARAAFRRAYTRLDDE